MRVSLPSGGSHKLTIPVTILKEKWRKSDEEIKYDRFLVCFIEKDGKILLELPEYVIESSDYPEEVKKKVSEDLSLYQKRLLAKMCDELYVRYITGNIHEAELEIQINRFKEKFTKMAKSYRTLFSQRELHFIASDEFNQLLAAIAMEEEKEKEENFLSLLDDVKKLGEELTKIRSILFELDKNFSEGKISRKMYELLREKFSGKLVFAESRMKRLKETIQTST
jgi:hypothetical protein